MQSRDARDDRGGMGIFHVETLKIYKLGFNQNYNKFALILLKNIVLRSKYHRTKFIN